MGAIKKERKKEKRKKEERFLEPLSILPREIAGYLDHESLHNLALTCKPVADGIVAEVCFTARCARNKEFDDFTTLTHLMRAGSIADSFVNRFSPVLAVREVKWPDPEFDYALAGMYIDSLIASQKRLPVEGSV